MDMKIIMRKADEARTSYSARSMSISLSAMAHHHLNQRLVNLSGMERSNQWRTPI
ncbi:hypothetical protein L208DRAFT_1397845 [Tricholoma matsutake]|nr:hypothetical protein L208DRAFT_1402339 [Tricholoma matsutake 945]KAF8232224.1 hypothetical protein L208DRAFT_1397845 [Tricholoma matsutake 945]